MTSTSSLDQARDLSWAAGLLEGEGTFYLVTPPTGLPRGRIQCRMGDPEVLHWLRDVLGAGHVNGPYEGEGAVGARLTWVYQVNRQDDVARLARALKPRMSRRRQNQIGEMLTGMGEL